MTTSEPIATLLLVDDEPLVTDGLKRAFHPEPYRVLTAASAAEALEIIANEHVDVIISDEKMPGMPGSAFLALVRQRLFHSVRIILSGQATLDDAVRAINDGEIHRFLVKPCNTTDLLHTVRQALTHQRLEAETRHLLKEYHRQSALLARLGAILPGLRHLETDDQSVDDEADGGSNVTELIAEIQQALKSEDFPTPA